MDDPQAQTQRAGEARFVLHPHRSLDERGFMILMALISGVSFVAGAIFWWMGAWPVMGFFGLDVALIYLAFRLNYRAGEIYETVDLTPEALKLTRVHPSGAREVFDFNPYWARLRLSVDRPDGRTSLRLVTHGQDVPFAQFLTDDERRDLAEALSAALARARAAF